ncbi:MAG TPA: extracellular solute-binding protein [Candidatus Angelobacter sp.]|nr:extracellular solute-binding protein [Candidatus Angelobacter sp.]
MPISPQRFRDLLKSCSSFYLIATSLSLLFFTSCNSDIQKPNSAGAETETPSGTLELVFTYGSEKEKWITAVTDAFNSSRSKTKSGKAIFVRAIPEGSGESIDELLEGRRHAHITSPASAAFIKLGNAQSRVKTGKDLVGNTDNLLLSPVVIAMWKPMAEAIGWGKKPIGWADVLALAHNPKGWAAYGFPQWGQFKFGHTHPEFSNSGLISVVAEAYAASGKTSGLTAADIAKPRTAKFVSDIENSIVHYGSSTGFFGRKMYTNGPQYLSAAVLYENMVIESYGQANMQFPIVAIYPKEGTFWSDHPIGVVEREWVTPEHREAAKIYIDYLLARPQQEKALAFGFRPAAVDVPLAAPIDADHGVDPKEPKTTLEVPPADVIDATMKLWQRNKKHSEVVLVLDTSGSMQEDMKMVNAKMGARQLISMLGDEDVFSLEPFSTRINWAMQDQSMKVGRDAVLSTVDSLIADGATELYDAIDEGYSHLASRQGQSSRIQAVVVLTDGEDTNSKMKLPELLARLKSGEETKGIRIFTIAYGRDARQDVLSGIADATQAKFYKGTPQNIVDVFKDISTFF